MNSSFEIKKKKCYLFKGTELAQLPYVTLKVYIRENPAPTSDRQTQGCVTHSLLSNLNE